MSFAGFRVLLILETTRKVEEHHTLTDTLGTLAKQFHTAVRFLITPKYLTEVSEDNHRRFPAVIGLIEQTWNVWSPAHLFGSGSLGFPFGRPIALVLSAFFEPLPAHLA